MFSGSPLGRGWGGFLKDTRHTTQGIWHQATLPVDLQGTDYNRVLLEQDELGEAKSAPAEQF